MEISYYLLLIPLLYLLTNQIIKRFNNLPPSPFPSLPVIGHLHLIKNPVHRTLAQISSKYGRVLLLYFGSRPVLLISSPSAAVECFTKNDIVFANRPKFLAGKYLGFNYTTLVWASYGQHWRNIRKIATVDILSGSRVQMFTHIRSEEVHLLIRRLLKAAAASADDHVMVDMKSAFFELTLNIMMRMIAGKRYSGDGSGKIEEVTSFQEMVKESLKVSGSTNAADFVPLLRWIGQNKLESHLKTLQMKREKFLQDLIEKYRSIASHRENKTLIDVLLSLQETEPEYYTDQIIRGLVQIMLSAGSDTTSGTMEWALSVLLNNPEALKKAQEEIDVQIGQSRLITDSDLGQLPYLQAIINETFRMYPVSPFISLHESSEECTVEGFGIPRGTLLLVNLWAINHDPEIWEEPTKFKPERFMNLEGQRERFEFMPFGLGRRGCPGENFARRVVGLALGSLIQCFEWERPGEELVDMSEGAGHTMPRAQPLLAKYRPRPEMVKLL
ncbi:cytochrome P450 81Q32-like [Coffea arabica]|uniref:Cytochrome P450 81Q32-like n=1 Tax=Coffea arabica TaxID=13443 RepID=A0A6P6UKI2_COFAR|nr:isoflavone 3'-hydroxylase-like [Coffea arabica]